MSRTTIQIPVDTALRDRAEVAAAAAGFSSVQEVLRVFLNKFSSQAIDIGFYEKGVRLSENAEMRYASMVNDAKAGKNVLKPASFEELLTSLE